MSIGQRFVDKCISTEVELQPWPHQILHDTFDEQTLEKLTGVCLSKLLHIKTDKLIQIHPKDYLLLMTKPLF